MARGKGPVSRKRGEEALISGDILDQWATEDDTGRKCKELKVNDPGGSGMEIAYAETATPTAIWEQWGSLTADFWMLCQHIIFLSINYASLCKCKPLSALVSVYIPFFLVLPHCPSSWQFRMKKYSIKGYFLIYEVLITYPKPCLGTCRAMRRGRGNSSWKANESDLGRKTLVADWSNLVLKEEVLLR